ncbi:hypothetical protein TPA0910_20080 [Streptomyces hygroscopicus subsp. sporocinereus]|uniref:Uncharacterized protein n=1 Tax=Streptomyces hygroscopicus TaxID=1912 RepID=A0ABQ3TW80_STRHY|nr:hypothetical protein TPA0910_20080 [Streptomyces hygroscopicus]GLV73165.1 hypothetical protein Shyhy02_11670 [Streptomyces hygroscopicus subsp. hygroscopicus]
MGDDPQQPGPERRLALEPPQREIRLHKGVLHHILGIRARPQQPCRAVRDRCMDPHQLGVRLGVAGPYPRDDLCFTHPHTFHTPADGVWFHT